MKPCYLDHNAGEPLTKAVTSALAELNALPLGNPNSLHSLGLRARREVERARESIARATGAPPSQYLFTSGGSSANATIVVHTIMSQLSDGKRPKLIYGATEHPSVLNPLLEYERLGLCVTQRLEVSSDGLPDLELLATLVGEADGLFLMAANNETGLVHDLEAISQIVEAAGIPWHCDAVQLLGKEPLDMADSKFRGVSSATLTAHKIGGPSGCGALILRKDPPRSLEQLRMRATPDIMGIVGFAAAIGELNERLRQSARLKRLRDHLENELLRRYPDSRIHGRPLNRLPNTTAISLRSDGGWIDGEDVVLSLAEAGFCVSTGAACSTGSGAPSHVLLAMGLDHEQASASLRISLGPRTNRDQLDGLLNTLESLILPRGFRP